MRGKNDAVATRRQRFNALHDAEAVAIVKTRRRLVHDERVRVLDQRPAEQHQLPFAAGDAHTPARSQRADAKLVQNPLRCVRLLPRGAVKRPELRAKAHQNAVEHRMVERRTVGLRNIRKLRRQRAAGIVPHVAARDFDAAALRLQKAEQTAEQRALSHAVRAEHGNTLAPVRAEADAFQYVRLAIGKHKVRYLKLHPARLPSRLNKGTAARRRGP